MSSIKRHMEDMESKRQSALEFLIDKGYLERCEYHEECVYEVRNDLEGAFRTAAFEFARGKHQEFKDQRDFTDHIKQAYEDNCADGCPVCESYRKD